MATNKRQLSIEVAKGVEEFLAKGGYIKQLEVKLPEKPVKEFFKPVRCSDGNVFNS